MQTIVNLGTGGADLNGQNGSTASADSNDARFLDWPGDNAGNYVYLPGVASNYLSVPDEAALDITGDIDIRVKVAMDDWTPAANQTLLAKWNLGTQNTFLFRVLTSGALALLYSVDGSTTSTRSGSTPVGAIDGALSWVRVTRNASTGETIFYKSDDGLSWTTLDTVTGASGNLFSSTSAVEIGTFNAGGGGPVSAKVHRAQILNGIDGTPVLDVDCSQITSGADTSFTALTGQTVTINRSTSGRKSVAVVSPVWLFGTDDYIGVLDNDLLDPNSSQSFSVIMTFRMFATPKNFGQLLGKWTPGYQMATSGTTTNVFAQVSDGANSPSTNGAGLYVPFTAGSVSSIGFVVDRDAQTLTSVGDSGFGTSVSISTIGSLATANSLFVANSNNLEVFSVAVWRRTLSVSEVQQLSDYFRSRIA